MVLVIIVRDFPVAKVMLASSHKGRFMSVDWMAIFTRRGIVPGSLESLPENHDRKTRCDGIMSWMREHQQPERFLILDDDTSLRALPPAVKAFLIQPSPMVGLTSAALRTIGILFPDQD